jgi:signal peptidase II
LPLVGLTITAVVIVLDQLSKYVVVEKMMDRVITLLPVLDLRLAVNCGASFSMFSSCSSTTLIPLIAVQSAITLALAWYMLRADGILMQAALGLIVGGALGNLVGRITLGGAVADFLDFHWGEWHFPTFNLADSCLTIGVMLWLLDALGLAPHHTLASEPHKD